MVDYHSSPNAGPKYSFEEMCGNGPAQTLLLCRTLKANIAVEDIIKESGKGLSFFSQGIINRHIAFITRIKGDSFCMAHIAFDLNTSASYLTASLWTTIKEYRGNEAWENSQEWTLFLEDPFETMVDRFEILWSCFMEDPLYGPSEIELGLIVVVTETSILVADLLEESK